MIWSPTKEGATKNTNTVQQELINLGFTINTEKSTLIPKQQFTWLGIAWDTQTTSWGLPEEKRITIREKALSLLGNFHTSRRQWEEMTGLAAFTCQIVDEMKPHFFPLAKPQVLGPTSK